MSGPRAATDLRLVPVAVVVWATTLIGLFCGGGVMMWLAAAAVLAVPLVGWFGRRRWWCHGILAVLVALGVTATGTGVRLVQLEHHPLRDAVERGADATVRVVLNGKPKPVGSGSGSPSVRQRSTVRANIRYAEISGQRIRGSGALLLLVPTEQWRGVIPGQEVTVSGELVAPRDPGVLVAVVRTQRPPVDPAEAPGWQRVAEELRVGLRRCAVAVLGPEAAGLLSGLVVGDTSALSSETRQDFATAGLTHLTAVSGANLAIVCGAVAGLVALAGMGPVVVAVAAGLSLVGFVVLVGPEPSVLRAAAMGGITLAALAFGRQRSTLPALAAGVVGLLLLLPDLAVAPGFALSVTATAGLVLLAPGWAAAMRRKGFPVGVAEALAVPAAAQLVTAPLVAALSGEVSVVAVVANLLVGPVIAPATVLGVLATVLMPVSNALASALVWLSGPELHWVLGVAHHAAALPWASFGWFPGVGGGVLLAVLAGAALLVLRFARLRWALAALVIVTGSVLIPRQVGLQGWPPRAWSAVVCDVGEGDALVLATGTPDDVVVVDTGPSPDRTSACLRRLGVRSVSLVVLSHLHADHIGGLPGVLANHPVGGLALGRVLSPAAAVAGVVGMARERSVDTVRLAAGQRMRWPRLEIEVLGPVGSLARSEDAEDANDASLVLRATTPSGKILLTGDVEHAGQSALLAAGTDVDADILKIPHHGSRNTAARFLRAVHPRLAVVSVGADNGYGHPSPVVLGILRRSGAAVLRTDEDGDIAISGTRADLRTMSRGGRMVSS